MAGKRRTRRAFGTVRKKGNRYYAEYTGPDGGQHTPGRSFPTVTDVDGWLAAERRLIDLDVWTPPAARQEAEERDHITVGEWLDTFHTLLEQRPEPPKKSTMQNYRRVVRTRITEPLAPGADDPDVTRLAGLRLVDVTKGDVYRWHDGVQRHYGNAATINMQAYKRLRAAFDEAVRREMVKVNPVDVPRAGKKLKPGEKHLPEDSEIDAILEAVPAQYRVMTSLTLHHGLRIGEALALKRENVQVEWLPAPWMPKVNVTVEQNAQKISDDPDRTTYMLIQDPKTNAGHRTVPIMARDVPYFLEHLARYAPWKASQVDTWEGPRAMMLLTVTSNNRIVMDSSFRNVLERARERAGVTSKITPHSGRDWLITRLAEHGAHLKEIGRLLGQQDLDTIMHVYMQVRAGRTESLMEQVNASVGQR